MLVFIWEAALRSSADPCGCEGVKPAGVALTTLAPGQVGTVCETCMEPADAAMLRDMGLRPGSRIRLCRLGEPSIVEVLPGRPGAGDKCDRPDCRCRIGLTSLLASRVKVVDIQ